MTFNLARILESKRQHRRALAALPIAEKLRLLDDLRQRTLDLRSSHSTSLSIELGDLDDTPFNQNGGLGKAHQLFGDQLPKLLEELNECLQHDETREAKSPCPKRAKQVNSRQCPE